MFDEFLKNCPMDDKIMPSKKRVRKNAAAVKSLIEKEESSMTKRKFKLKPLIIAAAITIACAASLITVNAATNGAVVNFFLGGEKIEGDYDDYVDRNGYRHISFRATLPVYEENYAVIYDVDAPREEAVRVITDDTDHEFMEKLRQYRKAMDNYFDARNAWCKEHNITKKDIEDPHFDFDGFDLTYPEPEDFGAACKDNELCLFNLGFVAEDGLWESYQGSIGGNFMTTGTAEGHPSGTGVDENGNEGGVVYDWETETKIWNETFYYYVGKE